MQIQHPQAPSATVHALRPIIRIAFVCAAACLVPVRAGVSAQGVTTATVQGSVRASDGADVEGARVTVVSMATGFVVAGEVRSGRFLVQGLEIGGPYTISVQRPGFHTERRDRVFLALGQLLELHFVLRPAAIALDTVQVAAIAPFPQTAAHGGTATTLPDSLLHRLPTLNRNLYEFVRLVPQISTRTGFRTGFSGGGVGLRFNNYLINGVPERSDFWNATAEFGGGKSVPLEAVKEYQVLLAPYDVRYGDFAGGLVNTVTRAGTNRFEGSVFAYARNDRLARRDALRPYERVQYGFSLGGPILPDRLHFFVAPELQHATSPAPGPYVGQATSASAPIPATTADLARLDDVLRTYGLEAGSGGPVQNRNPLANVFARLDVAVPAWNSRAVLWTNHARFSNTTFARPGTDTFPLSTYQSESSTEKRVTSIQLRTTLRRAGGGHNELVVSHNASVNESRSDVQQPIVRVSVPGAAGGVVTLVTGTPPVAQGSFTRSRTIRLNDNLTLPLGASHVLTLGAAAEHFRVTPGGVPGTYGAWTFSSLDSLDRRLAERYEVARDFGSASVPIAGTQYGVYVSDRWRAGGRLSVTMGVRADLLDISGRAPYNAEVDSIFQRRTDEMPPVRVHWSPRLGFTWDVAGTGHDQLRGGVGIFTGRPPAAWIHAAFADYGVGIGQLSCGARPDDSGLPPPFVPDHRSPPTACATGSGLDTATRGDVDLLDRQLQMTRTLRASFAWDRRLPWDMLATGEALVTRNLADFVFVNLNLDGPQALDRNGRVLYGTIDTTGIATPRRRSRFPGVIDLVNTSRNHSYQLSARLEKRFARGTAATASYTYSRVRDVSTPRRTGMRRIVNWSARAVSGRHDDMRPGISLNDIRHRIVLAGTYRAPWRRWPTEFSFHYVGESGSPFTYLAGGAGQRGDLNADGSNANDPVYVPRSAYDTSEIRFSGRSEEQGADHSAPTQAGSVSAQQEAFDRFIERTPCLRRQRGRIMERNTCREPWAHTMVAAVRQTVPIAGRALEAELQVFNVLNLLRSDWGLYRVARPVLLEHVEQTDGPPEEAQPVFRFRTPQWTTLPAESAFQLQVALRYRF